MVPPIGQCRSSCGGLAEPVSLLRILTEGGWYREDLLPVKTEPQDSGDESFQGCLDPLTNTQRNPFPDE